MQALPPTPRSVRWWLQRLERRTEYSELRQMYEQVAKDAHAPPDPASVVTSIEQAIRLIGRESVRDQGDLASFEQDYEEFRDKERGVAGWIRRHLPFTETRRQDKAHRGEIEDQQAELRANLFFVARLRLLSDGLQSESMSLLGAPSESWAERIEKHRVRAAPRDVARVALELDAAVSVGAGFLTDIGTDIDGFSEADYRGKEQRAQRDADLEVARKDLGLALAELEAKRALFQQSRQRLRRSLEAALEDQDVGYRDARDRIERVTHAQQASEPLGDHLEALHEALESLRRRVSAHTQLDLGPAATNPQQAVALAQRALEAARAELRARSEQSGMVEADPAAGFDDGAVRAAESALEEARAARQAQAETTRAKDRLRSHLDGLDALLAPYLRANRGLMRLSELPHQSEALLRDLGELRDEPTDELISALGAALERSARLQAQLAHEQTELHEDADAAARETARLFRAHARTVMGEGLLEFVAEA